MRKQMGVITRRWLLKTFGLITLLMALVVVSLSAVLHVFYYNAVRNILSSGYNSSVAREFAATSDEDFNRAARSFIRTYGARDTVDVWVINRSGKVVATSDGFRAPDDLQMDDYAEALKAETRSAAWIGRTPGGERMMAMTFLLGNGQDTQSPALRFSTSLTRVDAQLRADVLLLIGVSVAAILLALLPSTLYIEKIVRAVCMTTEAADRIAKGDYSTRIDYTDRDEIGALCEAVRHMAEEIGTADRMKNEFISTVSHELRTPLTAIRGWGETLRQAGTDDPALMQRGVDVILHETKRLGGMVEDLLDFSRMQSGRLELRLSQTDMVHVLEEALQTFRARAGREGKRLLYAAGAVEAVLYADADRITQVFVNVIDNAFKYTDAGGTIRVQTYVRSDSFHVCVRDTGRGIAAHDLPHVKEKFYKADHTAPGSGIGLAVADEIVRRHGGTLDIESVRGEGTAVTITLPLSRKEERSPDHGQE